jgi:hypothetical protein
MSKINALFRSFIFLFFFSSWKIPQSNRIHFALRYDDTHKFVTEQVKNKSFI